MVTVASPLPYALLQCEPLFPLSRGGASVSIPLILDRPVDYLYDQQNMTKVMLCQSYGQPFMAWQLPLPVCWNSPCQNQPAHCEKPQHMQRPHEGVMGGNTRRVPQLQSAHTASYLIKYRRCPGQLSPQINVALANI